MNAIDKLRERDAQIAELEAQRDAARGLLKQTRRKREDELIEENQRMREANRRLQTEGPALERDKVIDAIRANLAAAEARAEKAERDFKALCQQTDQRESEVSDQFTLLDKSRLAAEAEAQREKQRAEEVQSTAKVAVQWHRQAREHAEAEAQREKQRAERFEQALMEETDNLILATRRAIAAEAEAQRMKNPLDSLVNAVARARKAHDDFVRADTRKMSHNAFRAIGTELEDAHASLIIVENAARAALAPAEAPPEPAGKGGI